MPNLTRALARAKTPILLAAMPAAAVVATSLVQDKAADAARRPLLTTLWVVVNEDGTLDRGKGVTDSTRLTRGAYRITFNRNVSGCAYAATVDLSGIGEGHAGGVYVGRNDDSQTNPTTARQVDVTTYNSTGTDTSDNQFDLIVYC